MYEDRLTGCQLGNHQDVYGSCGGTIGHYSYKAATTTPLRRCQTHAQHLVVGWFKVDIDTPRHLW